MSRRAGLVVKLNVASMIIAVRRLSQQDNNKNAARLGGGLF